MSRRTFVVLACVVTVLLAGCALPDDSAEPGPEAVGLTWRQHEHLGPILTDAQGHSLYVFTRDALNTTTCVDDCAVTWPPAPGDALDTTPATLRARLTTFPRADGSMQLAIDARPLYRYAGDEARGDANGQGRGGVWFVVRESDVPGRLNADFLDGPGAYQVRASNVTYGDNVTGYLAQPDDDGAFPGVVLIHEWWGLNDHIRRMADALATHGYVVLAVDLYNGTVASDPAQALAQVQALDQARATADLRAAVRYLRDDGGTSSVASLGWCFGGGQSLQLALSGEQLDATVIYYGRLDTDPANLSAIRWPVLGIFGAEDTSIPVADVRAFETALEQAGVEADIHVYDAVGHAFANPSGDAYAPEKAMDAWAKTLTFLAKHLGQEHAPPTA